MSRTIYVGNLPFAATTDEVQALFMPHGTVTSVHLITDRETGRPRGFGFVEMENGVEEAIAALDDSQMGGRTLKVSEARPKADRP